MVENVTVKCATAGDVGAIQAVLTANARDTSLFLRSGRDITRSIGDFVVARDGTSRVVGCAAMHRYRPDLAELLSVAVVPEFHRCGVGALLVSHSLRKAASDNVARVWLATAKPTYFARFGFRSMSRWGLPTEVLVHKLTQVFEQPAGRWFPSLFARFTFMTRHVQTDTET